MNENNKISAKDVAEYFIWKTQVAGKYLTNKKLQKLIYYAQAWSLVSVGEKLFEDKIEAWVHGPAVRDVYLEYKQFGFSEIKKKVDEKVINKIPSQTRRLLDAVLETYGARDAAYLEHLTHSESPWKNAREGLDNDAASHNEITPESMRVFYSKLKK